MTLHWWMHWFWITAQILVIIGSPVPSTTVEPVSRAQSHPAVETSAASYVDHLRRTVAPSRQTVRVAKAIGAYQQSNTAFSTESRSPEIVATTTTTLTSTASTITPFGTVIGVDNVERDLNGTKISETVPKKDGKTGRIRNSKPGRSKYDEDNRAAMNASRSGEVEDLTVMPLKEEGTRFRLVLNKTRTSTPLTLIDSASSVKVEEVAEQRLHPTVASSLAVGVSESTRLSRARSAFTSDFQIDQLHENERTNDYDDIHSDNIKEDFDYENSTKSTVDIAAITGSCLATVILLSTIGSVGFVIYRRRYLNPPQTLNSDKCSNPDSSGYIDDSTIRDNSEEMYSLDNDSFLNSLEAMTIQNYWTDVKHTKL